MQSVTGWPWHRALIKGHVSKLRDCGPRSSNSCVSRFGINNFVNVGNRRIQRPEIGKEARLAKGIRVDPVKKRARVRERAAGIVFTHRVAPAKRIMAHEPVKVCCLASTKTDRIDLKKLAQPRVINSSAIIVHSKRGQILPAFVHETVTNRRSRNHVPAPVLDGGRTESVIGVLLDQGPSAVEI